MCTEYHNHNCSIMDYTKLPAAKDPHISEQYEDWYIGPRWVGYNMWYTDKGLQRVVIPHSPLTALLNATDKRNQRPVYKHFILLLAALREAQAASI